MTLANTTSFEDNALDRAENAAAQMNARELRASVKELICVVEALDNRMTALAKRNHQLEIDIQAAQDQANILFT
jgi:hypothetical protein